MIEDKVPAAGILRKRSEFEAVLRFGLRLASRNFVLRARANEKVQPRLGIIASRKAASRAVDRNRGKRFIREAFRTASTGLGGYDVTIQLRSDLRSQDNTVVRVELRSLLQALARRCAVPARDAAPHAGVTGNGEQ